MVSLVPPLKRSGHELYKEVTAFCLSPVATFILILQKKMSSRGPGKTRPEKIPLEISKI